MFCFIFIGMIIKISHLLSISLSHNLKAFVPHGYVLILSDVCNLFSSLLLSAILFTGLVYKLCASLLNRCSIGLLLNKHHND